MSAVFAIRDGETITHRELMVPMGFKTDRAVKEWINEHQIPYYPRNGVWWMAGEDIRAALRHAAKTHKQWHAIRNREDPMEDLPSSKKTS
ncbi:hypothetical protein [Rhodopirellula europaea]|uniref:hypothetical protein n=1 Tax=Rhodopirellula europaea TaxID=1263866 RepID=UPI003D2C9FFB|tara:strand:- start:6699 stop:6968 length:270 start_codon:yes stop_codon:yes gene_type:complete